MPRANRDLVGDDRVPRSIFEHAHESGSSVFPPELDYEDAATILYKHPANWVGFDRFRLWVEGLDDNATFGLTVVIMAGTCGEGPSTHIENHSFDIATTIGQFTCVNLLTTYATVIALISDCDMVTITVVNNEDSGRVTVYGIEIVES